MQLSCAAIYLKSYNYVNLKNQIAQKLEHIGKKDL